jgi:DNA-3-methyladenine glycosylase II
MNPNVQDPAVLSATAQPLDETRLRQALTSLAEVDPDIAEAMSRIGCPAPRTREPGFATLLRIVTAQQLSTRAAAAIWGRLEQALGGRVTADGFLGLDEAALRAVGFSLRKAVYGRELAAATLDGTLAVETLGGLEDEEVIARITALRGFGRWSAEIYLLFALGRVDSFPADDLALQVGAQRLKRLEERPTGKALRVIAEGWQPYRGAAAIFLWHYYGAATLDERR